MTEPIRGKVAKVLSDKAIAINVGFSHGVDLGMKFDVMGYIAVKDPDSAVILESIEVQKVRVEVTLVQEKVSVATTFKKRDTSEALRKELRNPLFQFDVQELIKTDKTFEEDEDWNKVVRVGDGVIQVL